jgi:hypothetical protein
VVAWKAHAGIDWTARPRVFWLMAMVPAVLIALRPSCKPPPVGASWMYHHGLSTTLQWVLALIFGLVLLYFIYDRISALGWVQACALSLSLIALGVWTVVISYPSTSTTVRPSPWSTHATPA